jgi:hypothetical protein
MAAFYERHPNLSAWALLAVGMVAVLAWSARDVGLNAGQWFWLVAATVLVAGLCAWIISWEADGPEGEDGIVGDADRAGAPVEGSGDGGAG